MADMIVSMALLEEISPITTPHLKSLNADITEAFAEQPDMAFTLAEGLGVSVLLTSLSDPVERLSAVDGINILVSKAGFALTPLT